MAERVSPWSIEGIINFFRTGLYDPSAGVGSADEYLVEFGRRLMNGTIPAIPLGPEIDEFMSKPWDRKMVETVVKVATDAATVPVTRDWLGDKMGVIMGSLASYVKDKIREQNSFYPEAYQDLAIGADAVIDFLVQAVTGLNVPNNTIRDALSAGSTETTREALGSIFVTLLDETLQLDDAAQGFLNRTPGEAERGNMSRLVGAAFRMQIGDMVAGWIAGILPFGLGDGATQIAERIDKAINMDDAIEEIIQVPMEAAITRGLTEMYNRRLKPQDFTESEAKAAFLQERISRETLNKVLDNQGVRDDIRQTLLDMAAPDLTESDIDQLYQHNLLDRNQVKEHYKDKGFQEPERELKTKLAEGTRRWKLEEKVFELYGNLYRDGVATKDEVRPHLEHFGYDADEVEMWFQVQELERRQRKWLSSGKLVIASQIGLVTPAQAVEYMQLQGMTAEDAQTEIELARAELSRGDILRLVSAGELGVQEGLRRMKLLGYGDADARLLLADAILEDALRQIPKKIKDECLGDNYEVQLIQTAIRTAVELDPGTLLTNSHFFTQAKCVLEKYLTPTG